MRILAFDTSTGWCSIALGDGVHWLQREEPLGQTHSERLLPMALGLLAQAGWHLAELDGIGFGSGPGSFTGVRIACGVAQGLAFGLDRPVVPVCTLQAIAHEAARDETAPDPAARDEAAEPCILACTDARMNEVYVAGYCRHEVGWQSIMEPTVLPPAAVSLPAYATQWTGAGNGFAAYPELAQRLGITRVLPEVRATGRSIGELALPRLRAGEGVGAEEALPLYVRQRVALTAAQRAAGERL